MLKNILNGLAGIFHSKSEISRLFPLEGRVVKVPLRTHVFVYNVHKGVMVKPFNWLLTNSNV